MNARHLRFALPLVLALAGACTDDDPTETVTDTGADVADAGGDAAGDVGTDATADASTDAPIDTTTDVATDTTTDTAADAETDTADVAPDTTPVTCEPLASDYSPGADDTWDECISDDNTYHQVQESISSIGRVAGFEDIADLLWRNDEMSAEDFIDARDVYATGEGLDSRVQRREDEHYPPVTDSDTGDTLRCRDEGVPAMDPDRCVGPAKILPILNDAFQEGILGNDLEVNAARVEAALLWFFYVSSHKEATTCTVAAKDCDSSYAYYTGGQDRDGGLGLAGYVSELAPDTHDRVWDGILAVRCWRDLDPAEEATDLDTRDLAIAQLDRALLHGVATVVLDRLASWETAEGVAKDADAAFLAILGPVLDREAGERDATNAAVLADAWDDLESADTAALAAAIEAIFPCP